jgi:hypothetical protein
MAGLDPAVRPRREPTPTPAYKRLALCANFFSEAAAAAAFRHRQLLIAGAQLLCN